MVGLNRVIFQTQNVTEDSKWLQNQAVTEALNHNDKIIELRKKNQKILNEIQDQHYKVADGMMEAFTKDAGFNVEVKSEV